MSSSGNLAFFTSRRIREPQALIADLLAISGATKFLLAFRTKQEEHGWEEYQRIRQEEWRPIRVHDGSDLEDIASNLPLAELPKHYKEGTCLSIVIDSCPLAIVLYDAVRKRIPKSIRGDFAPYEMHFSIGYHDIFEDAEHEDGLLICRAFLAVNFWGYFTPTDWNSMREKTLELPEVKAVKKRLEKLAGKLDEYMYWNV